MPQVAQVALVAEQHPPRSRRHCHSNWAWTPRITETQHELVKIHLYSFRFSDFSRHLLYSDIHRMTRCYNRVIESNYYFLYLWCTYHTKSSQTMMSMTSRSPDVIASQ